jgi:fimbrial chaperone protein
MNAKALRSSFAALLIGIASAGAFAFTMEPMVTRLSPSGEGRVATFRIRNDGSERLAVRFRVLSRAQSPEGDELNSPAGELFTVYPARALVEPGTTAAVKLRWRGPEQIEAERSFRFVAEQVPIDAASVKANGSGLKIMFRYVASLYVGEASFSPALDLRVTGSSDSRGESGYLVRLSNTGLSHVVAVDARVLILGGRAFSSEDLGPVSGFNYLAGNSRSVFVPSPGAVDGAKYEAKLEYEKAY